MGGRKRQREESKCQREGRGERKKRRGDREEGSEGEGRTREKGKMLYLYWCGEQPKKEMREWKTGNNRSFKPNLKN